MVVLMMTMQEVVSHECYSIFAFLPVVGAMKTMIMMVIMGVSTTFKI